MTDIGSGPTGQLRTLRNLDTPCLLLEEQRMSRNIARLETRLTSRGISLRPHLKTAKSVKVAQRMMSTPQGPAAVSTLKEARVFGEAGVRNLLYAVGIASGKLGEVIALRELGIDLQVVADSVEQAISIGEASRSANDRIPVLIEIDTDGLRSGVRPSNVAGLVKIGRALVDGGAELRGVMTMASDSYHAYGKAALVACAERERTAAVTAAAALREAGLPCPVVSVGSTPTAHFTENLSGVSEVRAGVFVFFDLFQSGLGVCDQDDIALSVLATVIGLRPERGWIIVDAGWTALSSDRSTAEQLVDQGYGLVCDTFTRPYEDLIVINANQEHGIVGPRPGSTTPPPKLPIGTRVRILPNHACATATQHDQYVVIGPGDVVSDCWPRFRGW